VVGCALALAGCGSWMPTIDFTGPLNQQPAAVPLPVDSEPPGAEARVPTGASCRTPCSLPVVPSPDLAVSFILPGFLPQTIPVQVIAADFREYGGQVRFNPNPVFAQLEPAPPPPKIKKKKRLPPAAVSQVPAKPTQQ
jgi:hypothetical protein